MHEPKTIVERSSTGSSGGSGHPRRLEGFQFTHDTSDISSGPLESMYTQLKSMTEKLEAELVLAEKIRAVDADDVAERVLTTHFIRDLMGNLSAFSKQKFRCTKCNTSYRRMPLAGKCTKFRGKGICNGNIIPTVHEGSVKKYLEMSREMLPEIQGLGILPSSGSRCSTLPSTPRSARRSRSSSGLADFM